MTGHRCLRCGIAWAGDTGPETRFTIITKYCPLCVEKLPVVRYESPIRRAVKPVDER